LVDAQEKSAITRSAALALASEGLAGCNANQGVNPSARPASEVFAGHDVDYNPYDPTSSSISNFESDHAARSSLYDQV
jgi:hypothetical protein